MLCSLRSLLLSLLAVLLFNADGGDGRMIERRAVTFSNQTTLPGTGTTSLSSTITAAPNASSPECCFILASFVHINTWYTNPASVYVASVITTWYQYNNTLIPYTSNTITIPDATSFYGTFQALGSNAGGVITQYLAPNYTTTYTTTYTYTYSSTSTDIYTVTAFSYTPVTMPSDIPLTLVGGGGGEVGYAASIVDNATSTVFPSQQLTIYSPTPYIQFQALGWITNGNSYCPGTFTTTSTVTTFYSSTYSSYTETMTYTNTEIITSSLIPFPGAGTEVDDSVVGDFVVPIPLDDPSFNLTEWLDQFQQGGIDEGIFFTMPAFIPGYLAEIPAIRSNFSNIGQCIPGVAAGEPTAHVPVSELTDVSHTTVTINGNYGSTKQTTSSVSPSSSSSPPSTPASPSPTLGGPTPSRTGGEAPTETPPQSSSSSAGSPSQSAESSSHESSPSPGTSQPSGSTQSGESSAPPPGTEVSPPAQSQPQGSPSQSTTPAHTSDEGASPTPESASTQAHTSDGGASPTPGSASTHQTQVVSGSAPVSVASESSGTSTAGLGNIIASVLGLTGSSASTPASQATNGGVNTVQSASSQVSPDSNPTVVSSPDSGAAPTGQGSQSETAAVSPPASGAAPTGQGSQSDASAASSPASGAAPTGQGGQSGASAVSPPASGAAPTGQGSQSEAPAASPPASGAASTGQGGQSDASAASPPASGAAPTGQGGQSDASAASPPAPAQETIEVTAGGQAVTFTRTGSNVLVGTQTLTPSGAVTVNGQTISLASSGAIVAGDSTIAPAPSATGIGQITVGGETITFSQAGNNVIVGTQTLEPDHAVTVGGETISLGPSGAIVASGSTIATISTPNNEATSYIAPGGSSVVISRSGSAIVVGSQTLLPGSTIVVAGQTLSIATQDSSVVAVSGTNTYAVGTGSSPPDATGIVTLAGTVYTYTQSSSGVILGSQTLAPGVPLTQAGETLSLAQGGSGIVVVSGTVSSTVGLAGSASSAPGVTGVATVGDNTLTYVRGSSDVVVGSQTLVAGSVITVSGEAFSIATGGSSLVAISGTQTSTFALATGQPSDAQGTTAVATTPPFTGKAAGRWHSITYFYVATILASALLWA